MAVLRWFFVLLALMASPALAAPTFPALTGRVVDEAGLLDPGQEAALAAKLAALEDKTGAQAAVVTVESLQGYDIADYGYQLGRAWGLGDKARNDGALLIVAPNERKVRIEVGYGLEGALTDALAATIIQSAILPKFREGDMAGGIVAGAEAMIGVIGDPALAESWGQKAAAPPAQDDVPIELIVIILVFVFFFVLPALSARGGRGRRARGVWVPPIVVHDWGGRDGGFGGGGGWSGGGGSFGGGGSSGSW